MRATNKNIIANNELITEVLSGNQIDMLYSVLVPFIVSVIRKNSFKNGIDIQELADDLFAKIYFKLDKFKMNMSLYPWVQTIVKNHLIDLYRKDRSDKNYSFDFLNDNNYNFFDVGLCSTNSPEEIVIRKEEMVELNRMLGMLKPMDKELIEGFYYEGKSLKELALEINSSVNAVSLRIFRAKNKLKALQNSAEYSHAKG